MFLPLNCEQKAKVQSLKRRTGVSVDSFISKISIRSDRELSIPAESNGTFYKT